MTIVPNKLLRSLSIALILFSSLIIFEQSSASRLDDPLIYPARLTKALAGEKVSLEVNTGKQEIRKFQVHYRKLGLAYRPTLMSMLPKGRIPVSGPSRRINDANN